MKKYIVGNWKMHGSAQLAAELAQEAGRLAQAPQVAVAVCPPAVWLAAAGKLLEPAGIAIGGQDCHPELQGAYTGDTSAGMLKEIGCHYVIVGHSERRTAYGETDALVSRKAARAMACGLIPIICIGETLAQREQGKAQDVVGRQVQASIPDEACGGKAASAGVAAHFVLAYEPVWAIGSGKTPTLDDIRQMHQYIVSVASERTGCAPEAIGVLYGGSVKAANAKDILAIPGVSGVLVGGASLKAEEFCGIIAAA